jgi:FtsH-binding integral membrane protein
MTVDGALARVQVVDSGGFPMNEYEMNRSYGVVSPVAAAERVTAFLRGVYGWMAVGLGITAAVAYVVAGSPAILNALVMNRFLFFGLMLAELGLVVYLSARVSSLAPSTAGLLFLVYSALNGVTLSLILLIYTGASIANAFVVAAVMFGALAIYGTTTARSLAGVGQFAFMGLIGVVVASIVGLFWQNDALQFLIAFAGVIVFTGLTAWDAQRLKQMALALPGGQAGAYAIVGALSLYLNFINLFTMLLQLMGQRNQ